MLALVQRVSHAAVTVEAQGHRAEIGLGLCVLLGVEKGDDEPAADWMARKLAALRIFPDDHRNMNRSVLDVGGAVLLVSQFTLAGDCSRGNRPSFDGAAEPDLGRALYERVAGQLREAHGLHVGCGIFGAMMRVELINEGPVTVMVRSVVRDP